MSFAMTAFPKPYSNKEIMLDLFSFSRTATVGFALAAALGATHAGVITTLPATGQIGSFGSVSSGSTPTYGQTFVATAALGLYFKDFTFYFQNSGSTALQYQAQVYAWNGTGITSPALFSTSASLAPTGQAYAAILTDGNDLLLQDQASYIALFTTINSGGTIGSLQTQTVADSTYAGGRFQYNNTSSQAGFSSFWNTFGNFGDMAFTMNFNNGPAAVPEPGSLALIGIAALCAVATRRRAA